ncbi:class I SAM-dependent methyltransferase [Mesorhizobium sp. VNQ89]|uniref:class I SAM-dependent methyltransferase n=1 Tax=Mesorhizobium quangtriensis TaxID=3157709 RepID=UPI0032B7505F
MSAIEHSHAELMDGVYRHQRHFYDLTRKYYLLGRDRLIDRLDAPPGGSVLELGCGTGRNLIQAAQAYPDARFHGLDISAEMLETAAVSIGKRDLSSRVGLARGDATAFDPEKLFGLAGFDRIFISYSLSMIPEWRRTIAAALEALNEGGSLHVVDFGRQERLPGWFKGALRAWLAKFHVSPRDSLREVLEAESRRAGKSLRFDSLYRGYAVHSVLTKA